VVRAIAAAMPEEQLENCIFEIIELYRYAERRAEDD